MWLTDFMEDFFIDTVQLLTEQEQQVVCGEYPASSIQETDDSNPTHFNGL